MAVQRSVGDVPGTEPDRFLNAPADGGRLRAGPRQYKSPGNAGRAEQGVSPGGVEMTVVPGDVLVDDGAGGGMGCYIVDMTFAHDENAAAVAQGSPIVGAGSHDLVTLAE